MGRDTASLNPAGGGFTLGTVFTNICLGPNPGVAQDQTHTVQYSNVFKCFLDTHEHRPSPAASEQVFKWQVPSF